MENKTLLKVENLAVALDGMKIFDKVSFEIHPQEVLAIIGPNGAGKTVLLKTLLGIIKPTSGEIAWTPDVKIGYLPQRFQVDHYLPMTVDEFLKLKPNPTHTPRAVLKIVSVPEEWMERDLAHLSSGELQKVLLAWAIMDNPQILLFDEPTENVDVVGQESIYQLLHNLQDTMRVAVILISHDLQIIYRYANHVLCLNRKATCYGEPHEALTKETLSELYGDHAFFHHHHYN
jgi:zinc transport system ATP-binding protein